MSIFIDISNTLFNAQTDKDGQELDYITFVPCATVYHEDSVSVTNYSWTFLELQSTFKNAVGHETYASLSSIGDTNKINPLFKLSDIQQDEVVFVNLGLEVTLDDGSVFSERANITLYRGDPKNTSFAIQHQQNGRIVKEYIYDRAVEEQILAANIGDRNFFSEQSDTVQGMNYSISQYLSQKKYLKEQGLDWSAYSDRGPVKNKDGEINQASEETFTSRKATQFVKNELAFYAHGRKTDKTSISTLLYQNPANFQKNGTEAPDFGIYQIAVENWWESPPGFNTFETPLLNPTLGKSAKFYFPGRSSHGGGSSGPLFCWTDLITFTWTPPTYPPDCPPGDTSLICQGTATFSVPHCVPIICSSC